MDSFVPAAPLCEIRLSFKRDVPLPGESRTMGLRQPMIVLLWMFQFAEPELYKKQLWKSYGD